MMGMMRRSILRRSAASFFGSIPCNACESSFMMTPGVAASSTAVGAESQLDRKATFFVDHAERTVLDGRLLDVAGNVDLLRLRHCGRDRRGEKGGRDVAAEWKGRANSVLLCRCEGPLTRTRRRSCEVRERAAEEANEQEQESGAGGPQQWVPEERRVDGAGEAAGCLKEECRDWSGIVSVHICGRSWAHDAWRCGGGANLGPPARVARR